MKYLSTHLWKMSFLLLLMNVSLFCFAIPNDPVGQLKSALNKNVPSDAQHVDRLGYTRIIERTSQYVLYQLYEFKDGKVGISIFHWVGNIDKIQQIQGELYNITDSLGVPNKNDSEGTVWLKNDIDIGLYEMAKEEDGYFHVYLMVSTKDFSF